MLNPSSSDIPPSISAPVQPLSSSLTELIRHKPLRRHLRLPYIPTRHSLSSDIYLSRHSLRHHSPFFIQNVDLRIRSCTPDRHLSPLHLLPLIPLQHTRHRRLRRPILFPDPYSSSYRLLYLSR